MSLKNKNVLITGGAGFIGSHFVDYLLDSDVEKIVCVDNLFLGKKENLKNAFEYHNFNFQKLDITEFDKYKNLFYDESIDVVFNFAVVPLPTSLVKPMYTVDTNSKIALNTVQLLYEGFYDQLIHISSSEIYGSAINIPMSENHPIVPETPYAASKLAQDEIVLSYYRTFGCNVKIARPFNNYGPRQNDKNYAGLIPVTIKRILDGQSPIIFGDGNFTRDYIYVTDTAKAISQLYVSQRSIGKPVNICSQQEFSVQNIVDMICNILEYEGDIKYKPERMGDVHRHLGDNNLAKSLIDFSINTNFEDGLSKTINWYLQK